MQAGEEEGARGKRDDSQWKEQAIERPIFSVGGGGAMLPLLLAVGVAARQSWLAFNRGPASGDKAGPLV